MAGMVQFSTAQLIIGPDKYKRLLRDKQHTYLAQASAPDMSLPMGLGFSSSFSLCSLSIMPSLCSCLSSRAKLTKAKQEA